MHYPLNSIISIDGNRATARSNYMVMVEGPSAPLPSVCGSHVDAQVKHDDVWLFQRRELVHAFRGDTALRLP